ETEVQVSSLLTFNGVVYASTTYYGVWSWNGSNWSQVGNLMDYGNAGDVYSLATDNGILYAGTADGVWAWNGSIWSQVGDSGYSLKSVQSILIVNSTLYAGTANQGVEKINLTSSLESDFKVTFTIDKSNYVVNNQIKTMDAIPFVENERTYIPVRYLALALGVPEDGIEWNPSKRTVIITKGNNNIILTIDSKVANINGESKYLDVAPVIREGRTYLPARFVAETLGYSVDWDDNSRTAIITQSKLAV
ncbi:MAG: copper amine oxidase N-terminal domain-containing protein, partial [Dysgonamonadaceae bacterium]|nr:copper amine oxidase N-terminal domain-containing protein [Dysgonamonadaceae bacterium]